MAWLYLLVASAFEVVWALSLKSSDGFTKLLPSALSLGGMILSVVFLALAVKTLPIGSAYAVWTGIGAALTAAGGIVLFNEPRDLPRLLFITLIVVGVVGLKLVSKSQGPYAGTG